MAWSSMRGAVSCLRRFIDDRGGNFATMAAMLAPTGLVLAAIAIDSGALFTQRRDLQGLSDLAAITAASNLGRPEAATALTLTDNSSASVGIVPPGNTKAMPGTGQVLASVVTGRYAGNSGTAAGDRFVAGGAPANAARVTLKALGAQEFGGFLSPPLMVTQSVARVSSTAAFSVGSRLALVNNELANSILGGLLGGHVSLSVMDYEELVKGNVDLLNLLDMLATKLDIHGGSYDDLLNTEVQVGKVAAALADIPALDHRSQAAFQAFKVAADPHLKVPLGKVIGLGDAGNLTLGGRPPGSVISTNALQLLTASAAMANGRNQAAIDLGVKLPGIASATLALAIGEPAQSSPWLTVGEPGSVARTAQTRLLLDIKLVGPGNALGTTISLPIYVELAYAEAKLTSMTCTTGSIASTKVMMDATPGLADVRIADIDGLPSDFRRTPSFAPATLALSPFVSATGAARVQIISNTTPLVFTQAEIDANTVKTVSSKGMVRSLTTSLISNMDLNVKVFGVDLGLSSVLKSSLLATLSAAAPSVDLLLDNVLQMLGVKVGQADVRVYGANCKRPALVQ